MTHRQRRRILVASYAAATALMVAACGSHTPSWFPMQAQKTSKTHAPDAAPATSTSPPKPLPANNLKSLVLSNEDVNEIAGLPLSDRSQFDSPTASASDYSNPDCALTMGITKDALGDGEFTAYRTIRNQASKDDSLVGMFSQNFATFETSDKASEIFHKAYATLGHCNSATIAAKDNPATWKILAPGPFNGDAVISAPCSSPTKTNHWLALRPPGTRQEQRHSRGIHVRMGQRSFRCRGRSRSDQRPDTASGQAGSSGTCRLSRTEQDQIRNRGRAAGKQDPWHQPRR